MKQLKYAVYVEIEYTIRNNRFQQPRSAKYGQKRASLDLPDKPQDGASVGYLFMHKKPDIDDEEKALFRTAMRGVKPLPESNKIEPIKTPLQFKRRKRISYDEPVLAPLSDFETQEPLTSEDLVEFKQTGIQNKVLRKMRAGQYNIEAILDLHGMTVDEAKEALYGFFLQCQKEGVCHVLVVHGKGRFSDHPILKNKLNHWLRQLGQVLAFCSAKSKDGRSGAMYVLLKHQKGEISS